MSFPDGTVPTTERVHPTPLYEALAAFAVAGPMWRLRGRIHPLTLFGVFAVLMGISRFLVEFIRRNDEVVFGLSQPQIWSLLVVAVGVAVILRRRGLRLRRARPASMVEPASGRAVARARGAATPR